MYNYKTFRRKYKCKFLIYRAGGRFLRYDTKSIIHKKKMDKLDFIKTKQKNICQMKNTQTKGG